MLYSKGWIEQHHEELTPWQQSAYQHFSAVMSNKQNPYPCVLGQKGFRTDTLRFGFAENRRNDAASIQLADLLKQYGAISQNTGKYASLVVFFHSDEIATDSYSVDDYQHLFWTLLRQVHELDKASWPEEIADDPHHHAWEFCFDGQPYFAFCATPAHTIRKSRHFPYFLIAFQPRWVFDEINSSTTFGQKIKKVIRKRLIEYDEAAPHPCLKWYGQADNYEWKQYYIRDDNSSLSSCPFFHMQTEKKS